METFFGFLAICAGNSPGTGEFPSQRPVTPSLDVFFDLRLNLKNGWVNYREAGDLRRHRAHHGVIAMSKSWVRRAIMFAVYSKRYLAHTWSSSTTTATDPDFKVCDTSYSFSRNNEI